MVDVAIIGGGICGCSLLYALSHYKLDVLLLEKTNDVGVGTTKANSAIVHAGYDPEPGTLMARFNVEGSRLIQQLCTDLDVLYKQTGSLVVAFDDAQCAEVELLLARGKENGVEGLRIVRQPQLAEMEPHLAKNAICALYAPTAAVVNPWELAFAQAETAVQNGAKVLLDSPVLSIAKTQGAGGAHFTLQTPGGPVQARFVVNAAGIHAAQIAAMAFWGATDAAATLEKAAQASPDEIQKAAGFTISTSRGQYFLMDKSQNHLAKQVIFQCPTPEGKGVLVSPTVHGNLIVGPNAEDSASTATASEGLAFVRKMATLSVPDISFRDSIRNFAGLRANGSTGDFIVEESPLVPGFFNMAGIKSPGLSAAPALALHMVRLLGGAGLPLAKKPQPATTRRVKRFNHMDKAQRAAAIAENPLYGRIVCRCETVTEGEIVDALHRPLPPRSLDAVKRRCGPGMGRCQGGFCGPRVQAIIARELGLPQANVPQDRTGMNIITGRTKNEEGTGHE